MGAKTPSKLMRIEIRGDYFDRKLTLILPP
jgi:hypothetical protein